jgi:hypothetical protein
MNNALDLYLHLKKWSDVITCYQILKKLSLVNFFLSKKKGRYVKFALG